MDKKFDLDAVVQANSTKRARLARDPNCPPKVLRVLAVDEDPDVRCAAGMHPNIPLASLGGLVKDESWTVRLAAAKHPRLSKKLLEQLATDKHSRVRVAVSQHPKAPASVLFQLLKDESVHVRRAVAQHPNASCRMLGLLSRDSDLEIQCRVAQHPNARPLTLVSLAQRSCRTVSTLAWANPAIGSKKLAEFELWAGSETPDYAIALGVVNNPATPPPALLSALTLLAEDPNTPPGMLNEIAADFFEHSPDDVGGWPTRLEAWYSSAAELLAGNPSTPVQVLQRLGELGRVAIEHELAGNAAVPTDLLLRLATGSDDSCRQYASETLLKKPDTPEHVKAFLALAGAGEAF